jgi:hypothetical protein
LENFSNFSRRFKSLLKFFKDSNVESVPGFLTLILGLNPFLEHGKASIFNFQVGANLDSRSSATRSKPQRRRADHIQTAPVALSAHGFTAVSAHHFCHPRPLPRVTIRGVPHRRAPPFFSFRSHLAPARLTIHLYHCCTRRR